MSKRFLALALCLVMAFSLAACGGNGAPTDPNPTAQGGNGNNPGGSVNNPGAAPEVVGNEVVYGNTSSAKVKHDKVVIALRSDPQDLTPVNVNVDGKEVLDSIYERIYNINGFGGELYGVLAKELPVEVEPQVFEFEIYDDIYDSDGNHITAADVVFSTNYLVNSGYAQNFGKFASIEAAGEYTVRMHTNAPLNELSDYANIFGVIYVWSEKAMQDHNLATDPCGTGPYICTYFRSGSGLTLEASDHYWAEGSDHQNSRSCANVQTIEYQIIGEQSQNAVALRTGTINYTTNLSDTDKSNFMAGGQYSDGFSSFSWPSNLTYHILPNCDPASVCSDENLRLAIMYAVDINLILAVADVASAQVAADMGNAKFGGYNAGWASQDDFYTYDREANLAKAQEYLDKSNYKGEPVSLLYTSDNLTENIVQAIQLSLGEVGINVVLDGQSFSVKDQVLQNTGAWDLNVDMMASDDYLVVVYERLFRDDNFAAGQGTKNYIHDDEFQRLIDTCMTQEGNTQENMNALHDYVVAHGYGRGLFATAESAIITDDILAICNTYKYSVIPGGCIYADNEW